jgi:hypothetical protein
MQICCHAMQAYDAKLTRYTLKSSSCAVMHVVAGGPSDLQFMQLYSHVIMQVRRHAVMSRWHAPMPCRQAAKSCKHVLLIQT